MTKNVTRIVALTLVAGMLGSVGTGLALAESEGQTLQQQQNTQLDTAPGPAYETISGTISKIDGNVYTVQQPAANEYVSSGMKANELRVFVGKETKKMTGEKRVGDRIRAEVTRGGFANSIQ